MCSFAPAMSTYIYTLSLHDALPICAEGAQPGPGGGQGGEDLRAVEGVAALAVRAGLGGGTEQDRKSTRLNSSHVAISYAVFCLKIINLTDVYDLHASVTPSSA